MSDPFSSGGLNFELPLFTVELYHPRGVFIQVVNAVNEDEAFARVVEMFREAGFRPVTIAEYYVGELEKPDGESAPREEN